MNAVRKTSSFATDTGCSNFNYILMPLEIGATVVIPAVVALVVALGAHPLTVWRERKAKRRELRLSHLVKSYRTLAKANEHPQLNDMLIELQEVIADIQFLGTKKQVNAIQTVVHSLRDTKKADLHPLLLMLRDDLRKEMGLEAMTGYEMWLRVDLEMPPSMSDYNKTRLSIPKSMGEH